LIKEQKEGRVLEAFVESTINFPPTYRFDAGTDNYDTSEKKRIPAYCDRILYLSKEKNIKNLLYTSHAEYMVSDHKPVVSVYELFVKETISKKYNAIYSEILKETDKMENSLQMEVSLLSNEFDFGEIKFNQPVTKTLSVKNTGNVTAQFAFIPKPGDESKTVSQKWLKINPAHGFISPSHTAEIQLTIDISKDSYLLNLDKKKLDDVIIFHLKAGGDTFVGLQGKFIKSCFGNSLENLTYYGGSIRGSEKLETPLKIPKELWMLVDYVFRNGLNEVNSHF
jgi:inositol polyphosphate 5-phosphatase INPP5B/F